MTRTMELARYWSRKATLAILVNELATWMALALLASGTLALLMRQTVGLSRLEALFFLSLVLLAPWVAWSQGRRRFPTPDDAVLWLERASGSTGALATNQEVADERWSAQVEVALRHLSQRPRIRWQRGALRILGALAFAAAGVLIDPGTSEPGSDKRFYAESIERQQEKLASLEEIVRLDEEVADELEERLEQMKDELEEGRIASTLESIDRFEDRLQAEAQRVQRNAEESLQSLQQEGGGLDAESRSEELARTLAQLHESGLDNDWPPSVDQLLSETGSDSFELPSGFELEPGQWSEISSEVAEMLRKKIGDLGKLQLVDPSTLEDGDELAELSDHECDENCDDEGGT